MSCTANTCTLTCSSGQQVCGNTCLAVGAQVCCPQDN
jgi:hypothetical protein